MTNGFVSLLFQFFCLVSRGRPFSGLPTTTFLGHGAVIKLRMASMTCHFYLWKMGIPRQFPQDLGENHHTPVVLAAV
ncbi:hypothetical protein QBC46DRAFT_389761 [Diplogelasinospora grovesii]|uniref:Secreted protein n=1 Tax=Diplogelasinospora grovesii TaxID=303347 RepID=A0AAN6S3H9_9PEZI|nr:hypothetical protein QBC46DRAFT_389761 [Diplogelasinospora grovesii]